jgi:DNA-nicking Smr family endonuclease
VPHYGPTPAGGVAPAPPLDTKLRRRLARGHVGIDATLDLHGMRALEAQAALRGFIAAAVARGDRNVLVITGKGLRRTGFADFRHTGVLRHLVPQWLAEAGLAAHIAGIDPAAQTHGGEGALYLRLKRARR